MQPDIRLEVVNCLNSCGVEWSRGGATNRPKPTARTQMNTSKMQRVQLILAYFNFVTLKTM
eukprot:5950850-Amphidinium_carterae.1